MFWADVLLQDFLFLLLFPFKAWKSIERYVQYVTQIKYDFIIPTE